VSITRSELVSRFGRDERLEELLAGRALDQLTAEEAHELAERSQALGDDAFEPISEFDVAAASLELAAVPATAVLAMPSRLQERLMRSGAQWAEETTAKARFGRENLANPRVSPARREAQTDQRTASDPAAPLVTGEQFAKREQARGATRLAPWLLAAASLAFAAVVWFTANNRAGLRHPTIPVAGPSARELDRSLANLPDTFSAGWGDWDNPEVPGVKGAVVWNESRQTGVMKFANLPALKPGEQYQLWIIDKRGLTDASGQSMRISGGVFDGGVDLVGKGELIVPIRPAIEVQGAAAFAVTIEKTGGTWVSDMKRRVVIAAKPS
jgi:hypothetical protein